LTLPFARTYNFAMISRMRMSALAVVVLFMTLTCAAQQPAAPPAAPSVAPQGQSVTPQKQREPVISTTSELVELISSVTDRRRKFITDLEQKEFKVLEDGKPQEVTFFSRQTDLPLRIGMLLDTSNSIRERLRFEQDAAIDFLSNVVRRNKDMGFLMTFDNDPQVIQDYTGDLSLLTGAISKQRAGGGTALMDAIYKASEKLINAPLAPGPNHDIRRVLVVISDGDDNLSDRAQSEAMEMAARAGVVIYAISTNTDWLALGGSAPQKLHKSHGEEVLEQFSDQTGGRVFFPYKIDDLAVSFQDIGSELRSQYVLAYRPTNAAADGRYHKIQVETDRKGLTVRTRKGYYAPRTTASEPSTGTPASK
jgi:Ca-activated chloride channel homolog